MYLGVIRAKSQVELDFLFSTGDAENFRDFPV